MYSPEFKEGFNGKLRIGYDIIKKDGTRYFYEIFTYDLSIKDENKVDSLKNAADLYAIIPKLEKAISNEDNIKQVKSYIINAYALVEQENWGEVEKNIIEAENIFKNITSNIEYMKNKEYKVNKTYVLIKELQNSLQYKDKKIFYIKYKDLLENINTL